MTIDATDRRIIAATQSGLPLVAEPYAAVADALGIDETDLLDRLTNMQASGVIRRIALAPNHYALGMTANGMSVWDVDDEKIGSLGRQVGALEFVSHCYERPRSLPDWPYNLFAMIHGTSSEEVETLRAQIEKLLGPACTSHDILYSTDILKKTGMRISPGA
jgi:DNA-binding Lrp family transcriptional regulator